MQVNIYSIFDLKAQAYLQPWFAANNAVAFRNCERSCKNAQSPFHEFPTDFTLFQIGEFNDLTGELIAYEHHKPLGNMVQFLPQPDPVSLPFDADTSKQKTGS